MVDLQGEALIRRLIARFANSLDLKAWDELGNCLSDNVDTDYSELRGTPPESMTKERFVEMRRAALQELQTHHLAGNVEISLAGDKARVTVSMVIYRKSENNEVFNTHCVYWLGVSEENGSWRIRSIVQKVLWNEGARRIHQGIVKTGP